MVLELKVPHGNEWKDLIPLIPIFLSYILSFVYIGIYWNNHHHLFQTVHRVNGKILWANIHLLFWLSVVPFATAWSGENSFSLVPVIFYGVVLAMAGFAYYILSQVLIKTHGSESTLAQAIGSDVKGKISIALYLVGMGSSFIHSYLAMAFYALVALIWLIPDRRIERKVQ